MRARGSADHESARQALTGTEEHAARIAATVEAELEKLKAFRAEHSEAVQRWNDASRDANGEATLFTPIEMACDLFMG